MKTKIIQITPTLLALIFIGFSEFSQWCTGIENVCFRTVLDRMIPEITYPLFFFAIYFLPITIILIFVPRTIFKSWLKLAMWAIPLSILFIASTPVIDTSLLPFYRDDAARLAGGVFAVASLILIVWKSISSRGNPN